MVRPIHRTGSEQPVRRALAVAITSAHEAPADSRIDPCSVSVVLHGTTVRPGRDGGIRPLRMSQRYRRWRAIRGRGMAHATRSVGPGLTPRVRLRSAVVDYQAR